MSSNLRCGFRFAIGWTAVALAAPALAAELDDANLDARIEKARKVEVTARVGASAGGIAEYRLIRHAFPFGTCVSARMLLGDANDANTAAYLQRLRAHFTCAVDENSMKWRGMEPQRGVHRDEAPMKVWEKCRELGLPMRGHCIFWGTNQGPAEWHKTLSRDELEAAMKARARHVLTMFAGKIAEWDLNNEMLHGDVYAKALGLSSGAEYFKWCKAIAPDVTFFVNDYAILSGGDVDKYVRQIRQFQTDGGQVGGIGVQCHFRGPLPTSEKLWSDLEKLAAFKLPIKVTEFDIDTKDEARQAADTRRFYKLCFAHPAVKGILMWGFWEGRHWKPDGALWRKDWKIKPNGEQYVKLLSEEWTSSGRATVGEGGTIKFRGYPGRYVIAAGGKSREMDLPG